MGELNDLPFHFWHRLELEHSWIFWAAPLNLHDDAYIERGLAVFVDREGMQRLVRRLQTAAQSPSSHNGPGRPPCWPMKRSTRWSNKFCNVIPCHPVPGGSMR